MHQTEPAPRDTPRPPHHSPSSRTAAHARQPARSERIPLQLTFGLQEEPQTLHPLLHFPCARRGSPQRECARPVVSACRRCERGADPCTLDSSQSRSSAQVADHQASALWVSGVRFFGGDRHARCHPKRESRVSDRPRIRRERRRDGPSRAHTTRGADETKRLPVGGNWDVPIERGVGRRAHAQKTHVG